MMYCPYLVTGDLRLTTESSMGRSWYGRGSFIFVGLAGAGGEVGGMSLRFLPAAILVTGNGVSGKQKTR